MCYNIGTIKKGVKHHDKNQQSSHLTEAQTNILFDKMDESWKAAAKYLGVSLKDFETWMFCD